MKIILLRSKRYSVEQTAKKFQTGKGYRDIFFQETDEIRQQKQLVKDRFRGLEDSKSQRHVNIIRDLYDYHLRARIYEFYLIFQISYFYVPTALHSHHDKKTLIITYYHNC